MDPAYIEQLRAGLSKWYAAQKGDVEDRPFPESDHSELVVAHQMNEVGGTYDAIASQIDCAQEALAEGKINKALDLARKVRKAIRPYGPPLPSVSPPPPPSYAPPAPEA